MINAMIELSKYILAFNFILYVVISYLLLAREDKRRNSFFLVLQNIIMVVHHVTGSLVLISSRRDLDYLFLPLLQLICLFAFLVLMRVIYPRTNRMILNHNIMFLSIGFLCILRLDFQNAIRQFMFTILAMLAVLIAPCFLRFHKLLRKGRWLYAILGIGLLGAVYALGSVVNGAKLSVTLAGLNFQASEFVKITFIAFIAGFFAKSQRFYQVCVTAVLAGFHVLLLVASTDLGSALIYFIVYFTVLFVATGKKRYVTLGGFAAMMACIVAYHLFSHIRIRVAVWLDPWTQIDGKGYQIAHSLFAIGTGGWFGLGIDGGSPTSIPYVEQDFIYASICEEYGVIFGIALFLLALNLFLEIVLIAMRRKDRFTKYLLSGISVAYIFQVFLTVGGNCKFIPMTGLTFPLVSYGGSSVLSSMLMLAIVQGISMRSEVEATEVEVAEMEQAEEKIEEAEDEMVLREDDTQSMLKKDNWRMGGLAGLYAVVFIAMLVYLGHYISFDSTEVISNPYNQERQQILASKTIRGDILAADGTVLATTEAETETRVYPYSEIFSHAIGYDSNGKSGVESLANIYLLSSNSSLNQKLQDNIENSKYQGDTVRTTLLPSLQEEAYRALGAYNGAVIVTEPTTGKVLAMVSKPDFNPNDIIEIWDELIQDTESSILVNRATQGLYPPGSTFKIITALEYIRENGSKCEDYAFDCTGSISYDGGLIHCYHGSNHGEIDFRTSFAKSCNSSFANIGLNLNRSSFSKTLEELLFNKELPIGLTSKPSNAQVTLETEDKALVQTVIGQGTTQMTPIHLAMLTAMIANDGEMMLPYCIDSVETSEGRVIKRFNPTSYGQLISREEAAMLEELMIAVVEKGTATKLSGQSYLVAGKTGSAEYNSQSDSHAWFTGYTYNTVRPLQVTVIVEEGGSGGEYAVPIARRIFDVFYRES